MGYKILKPRSPEEFFIELAIGLLLKSYTEIIMEPHEYIIELHRYTKLRNPLHGLRELHKWGMQFDY